MKIRPTRFTVITMLLISFFLQVKCNKNDERTFGYANDEHFEVIIVGGGIAGLTAAYFLADDGWNIRLLEKNNYGGGRALSGQYAGLTYAKGTEYLGKPEYPLNKLINWVDANDVEIPSPLDAIYSGGKFHYGEEGIAKMYIDKGGLANLNRFIAQIDQYASDFNAVYNQDTTSYLFDLDDITARQWLINNNYPDIYVERFNVACRGLFGANIDEISILSYLPEIVFEFEGSTTISQSEANSFVNEVGIKGAESTETYSFIKGIAELSQAIAKTLGNSMQYNSTVTEVKKDGNIYRVNYISAEGQDYSITADKIILATPAPITLNIASALITGEKKSLMEQIPYSTYITVAMYSNEPIWDKAFDLGVQDSIFFTDIYDATWIEKFHDASKTNTNSYITTAYIASDSYLDKSLLQLTDQQVIDKLYVDLEKIFPGAQAKVTGTDIHRFQYAYPVMTTGAFKRLISLNKLNTGDVILCGDYMLYPTFEEAAESGVEAAYIIIDE